MRVAFGFKAHSGWAALIVLGKEGHDLVVVERSRVELVEEEWARQPYHAAEELQADEARDLVQRGVKAAHRNAVREMRAALQRESRRENEVKACAVLVGNAMPEWTVAQILAVHFRMHQAEGVLFREALLHAAKECQLKAVEIPEKELIAHAERELKTSAAEIGKQIASLGKAIGPPWGKDQKDAALAAMIALKSR